MKQEVITLIPSAIAVYAAICAVVYFGNRLFMYFPNPARAAPAEAGLDHVKEIKIAAADGVMKAKRDHRVPLSERAVAILHSMPRSGELVFALSNMAMLELVKGSAGNGYTVHGFRSSFSDWARDRTAYPRDVVEMALAHSVKDKTEAAYRRGDAIEKRRRLMAEWARFCEQPAAAGGKVINMR